MKIGLVFDSSLDNDDGVAQYVLGVGGWLSAQGHEVHYLVGQTKRTDIPNVHSLSRNIQVTFNGNKVSMPLPTSRRRLRQLLAEEQFDVLHVQMPYSPFMAGRLIKLASPQTVVVGTFHILPYGRLARYGSRLLAWWLWRGLKRFDKVFSVSAPAAKFAKTVYGLDSAVLPNVFDYQHFNQAKPLPIYNDSTPTIVFLGRLVARKGAQVLLEAVKLLANADGGQRPPKFRVVICGGGPLAARLEAYVTDNGLREIVHFTGRVSEEDKPRYLASADIAVFPAISGESFGIVLLEAMASGRAAVLGGNNPGYASVLGANQDLLFDPRRPAALAQKLATYLDQPQLRNRQAKWCATAAAAYDVGVVGQKIVSEYGLLIAKKTKNR